MQFGLQMSFLPVSQRFPSKPSAHKQNMCLPAVKDRIDEPPLRQISPNKIKYTFDAQYSVNMAYGTRKAWQMYGFSPELSTEEENKDEEDKREE